LNINNLVVIKDEDENNGCIVNTIAVNEHGSTGSSEQHPARPDHRRQILALGTIALFGCVLFVVSRKLAWGREESLTGWLRWSLALFPYIAYVIVRQFSRLWPRLLELVKRSDFLPIWTISLLVFVLMRGSMIAPLYEAPIYDTTNPSFARYAILSALYIASATIIVAAWRVFKGFFTVAPNVVGLHFLSAAFAWVLFCGFVFLIVL
jgi:hypothetical protein